MAFLSLQNFLKTSTLPIICGMDEVGRGPWAGPVVACALIFKEKNPIIRGLKDSKQLTAQQREHLYHIIHKRAYLGVGLATAAEIDRCGLIKATNRAFQRALDQLCKNPSCPTPELLLIDGRDRFTFPIPHRSIIKGDTKIKAIASASIIAKVERDRLMQKFALQYPHYSFELHKGYGTARHQRALQKHGVCPLHRLSFRPVAAVATKPQLSE